MLKKIVFGLVLTCSAGLALAQEPKMGGVINAVIQPEPPGLMLAMIQNGPTQMVSGNIFEGLLRYSPKLEPLPGTYFLWLVAILFAYCALTQVVKTWFIRRFGQWL